MVRSVGFLLCAALLAGIFLRLSFLSVDKRTPDEEYYLTYAREIAAHGPASTVNLVDAYRTDKSNWVYPPPTRIGYTFSLAGFMKLFGSADDRAGVYLSVFFSVLSALILTLIGFRFSNPWATVAAVFFFSLSPMDLAIARRVFADNLLTFFGALLLYLTLEICKKSSRTLIFLFCLAGAYASLVKELGFFAFALCAAWLFFFLFVEQKKREEGIFLVFSFALAAAAAVFSLKWFAGDISAVAKLLVGVGDSVTLNTYAAQNQNGNWMNFLSGFWYLSPLTLVLVLLGIAGAFVKKDKVMIGIFSWIVCWVLVLVVPPYMKNIRYFSPCYAAYCLMAGWGFWLMVSFIQSKLKTDLLKKCVAFFLVLIVIISSLADFYNFQQLFIKTKIQDLTDQNIRNHSIYSKKLGGEIKKS